MVICSCCMKVQRQFFCVEGFVPMGGCVASKFGCCADGTTAAKGINAEGCPPNDSGVPCNDTEFGCCPDNFTVALGPYGSGCNISDTVEPRMAPQKGLRLRSVPLFPIDHNGTLDLNSTDSNETDFDYGLVGLTNGRSSIL